MDLEVLKTNWFCLSPAPIFLKRSFCYSGAHLWNSLPSNVRAIRSFINFSNEINRQLLSSYSHTANMPISFQSKSCN